MNHPRKNPADALTSGGARNSLYFNAHIESYSPGRQRCDDEDRGADFNNADWIRLPLLGDQDPASGLSRRTLDELTLPSAANNFCPPVQTVLMASFAPQGVRLVNLPSLRAHLDTLAAEANAAAQACEFIEDGSANGGRL